MKEIQFFSGEGRYFTGGVNYLISDDKTIYAECAVPEGATDDYGYLTMKKGIINTLGLRGVGTDDIEWFYDDDRYLEEDADAECEVFLDIDIEEDANLIDNAALIEKLYKWIGHDVSEAEEDIKHDYLTENTGRDGKDYLWYLDETTNAVIDADGNICEDENAIDELFC